MNLAVGTDIVEIERVARAIRRWPRFCRRIFTGRELACCYAKSNAVSSLAARFAAKEAVAKALGTGFRGFSWCEVEILDNQQGQPEVVLSGRAYRLAREQGFSQWTVSLSHSRSHAVAVVVVLGTGKEEKE
jgi:holo-[acyl-carrier protein] synthase